MTIFLLLVIVSILSFGAWVLYDAFYRPFLVKKRNDFYQEIKKQIRFEDKVLRK